MEQEKKFSREVKKDPSIPLEYFGKEEWRRTAAVYRETVLALADVFSGGKYTLEDSDVIRDAESEKVKTLVVWLDLFEKTFADFRAFLERHDGFIHQDFRKEFGLYIGSHGEEVAIHIGDKEIELVEPSITWLDESGDKLDDGILPEAKERLEKLHGEFTELMEQKLQRESSEN